MKKMKRIAAMTAALLICSGTMAYMPQGSFINADINTAYAAEESVAINETNFPDEIFREYVADNFDTDGDGILSAEEIAAITGILVHYEFISDLTGIEHFTALTELDCGSNQLTTLDVSNNTALTDLNCGSNQLTTLDISNNTALTELGCNGNQLTSLDVSNNTALKDLNCNYNQLIALDVSNNTALKYLYCENNQLISLDVSNCTSLLGLYCQNNRYEIPLTNGKFDLSTLPTGFDITKASEWTNGTVEGNILTVEDASKEVTYTYDCGNEKTATFTLIPTDEPVTPPTDEPTLPLGDINGDSTVDASDASNVLAVYALVSTGKESELTAEQIAAADVNKDGSIDASDASLILAYYAYISTGGTGTLEEYLNS